MADVACWRNHSIRQRRHIFCNIRITALARSHGCGIRFRNPSGPGARAPALTTVLARAWNLCVVRDPARDQSLWGSETMGAANHDSLHGSLISRLCEIPTIARLSVDDAWPWHPLPFSGGP